MGTSGLGKITLDLGLPGIPIFFWILYAVCKQVWVRLDALARSSKPHATMAFGLMALMAANAATFAVATQVFGDIFVLLMLGWSLGFLLALPAVAYAETQGANRLVTQPAHAGAYPAVGGAEQLDNLGRSGDHGGVPSH